MNTTLAAKLGSWRLPYWNLFVFCVLSFGVSTVRAELSLFERDVLPILNPHCLRCHGGLHRRAALDLRTASASAKGGETGGHAIYSHATCKTVSPESLCECLVIATGNDPEKGAISGASGTTLGSRGDFLVLLGFLWVAIAGVAGCGASRAGLRRGSEVRRGTNLRRDPHESRMDRKYSCGHIQRQHDFTGDSRYLDARQTSWPGARAKLAKGHFQHGHHLAIAFGAMRLRNLYAGVLHPIGYDDKPFGAATGRLKGMELA